MLYHSEAGEASTLVRTGTPLNHARRSRKLGPMSHDDRGDAPRVGLFGGSFDPVHNGHLEIADAARRQHRLDRVVFVPARHQPHKADPPQASGEQRLAMLRLAVRDRAGFDVSDCELVRSGRSYSIDTVRAFRAELGPATHLFFIIGSDSLGELPAWKGFGELGGLCTFLVASRPGFPFGELTGGLPAEQVTELRRHAIRDTGNPVSATDVRRRAAEGRPLTELVPASVAAYIAENKLYRPV